jgi:hypothetical protein
LVAENLIFLASGLAGLLIYEGVARSLKDDIESKRQDLINERIAEVLGRLESARLQSSILKELPINLWCSEKPLSISVPETDMNPRAQQAARLVTEVAQKYSLKASEIQILLLTLTLQAIERSAKVFPVIEGCRLCVMGLVSVANNGRF